MAIKINVYFVIFLSFDQCVFLEYNVKCQ